MGFVAGSKCTIAQNLKKSRLLREIHHRSFASRSELSKITGLNPSVVSRLTGELIDDGLIVEVGDGPSSNEVGRRSVLLGLNKSSRYVVGLDVGSFETKAVVCNLGSEVIAETSQLTSQSSDANEFITRLAECVRDVVTESRLELTDINTLVVAVPGSISPDDANLVTACNVPALAGTSIDKPLSEMLGLPVRMTNTTTAWSLAECEHAREMGDQPDFLLAGCGYGVMISALMGGKATLGRQMADHAKVDFGHIAHSLTGPQCTCGQQGCIEAYAGGWAIARDARNNATDLLLDLVDGNKNSITTRDAFDAAKRGDNTCLNIIREAGMIYGRWLAVFAQFFLPQRIIFGGQLVTQSRFYLDAVQKEMARHMPKQKLRMITFQPSALGKFGPARGAARMSIHELLNENLEDLVEMTW